MIKIGDFAKICNTSTQTLRYYDAEGVLKADAIDPATGYRFYTVEAVEKYKQILFYKKLGFSLDEIKKLQNASQEQVRNTLLKKKEDISASIRQLGEQIKAIDDICLGQYPHMTNSFFNELLQLPFSDDPAVVGKWELCGRLLDEHDLTSIDKTVQTDADRQIIFMPGGGFAWKYFWTKGVLYRLSPKYEFAIPNPYRTVTQDGAVYMIIQFMGNACIDNAEDAVLLLYRQVDNISYTEYQIRPNIDRTDLPFVEDSSVHGEWPVRDYVPDISSFDPSLQYTESQHIYITKMQFMARGVCMRTIKAGAGTANYMLRYTKGYVLNDKEMTAEAYRILDMDGQEYLFVQHKSGDYSYGGMTPHWYVFQRKS